MLFRACGRQWAANVRTLASRKLQGQSNSIRSLTRLPRIIASREDIARRSYATESTATTKKRSAAKKTTASKSATKPKKSSKKTAKKPAAKKKPAARKPKKPTRKPLTPAAKMRARVTELKKTALVDEPKRLPESGYQVYIVDRASEGGQGILGKITSEYKNVSSSEKEHLASVAAENKRKNQQVMQDWIKSHTPDQIRKANLARASLKRIRRTAEPGSRFNLTKSAALARPLPDDRQLKKPMSAFFLFAQARRQEAKNDNTITSIQEAASAAGRAWQSLSNAEKSQYKAEAEAANEEYLKEFQRIYPNTPLRARKTKSS